MDVNNINANMNIYSPVTKGNAVRKTNAEDSFVSSGKDSSKKVKKSAVKCFLDKLFSKNDCVPVKDFSEDEA